MLSKNVQISIEGNLMNDDCTTVRMDRNPLDVRCGNFY